MRDRSRRIQQTARVKLDLNKVKNGKVLSVLQQDVEIKEELETSEILEK